MGELHERARQGAEAIKRRRDLEPQVALILGTGLNTLAREIQQPTVIPYSEIPGFLAATAEGHKGELVLGTLGGKRVAAMAGRFHCYEGYAARDVVFPVQVLRVLGARTLIVSNACGGMNPLYRAGDLMLMDDHINLMGVNPLVGVNDSELGPRFPDLSAPYEPGLLDLAERVALRLGVKLHRGVYVGVLGPNLETRAEYRMLRAMGADVVGMSTVPEVLAAVHCGMRVLGVSCVTDCCLPDALKPADVAEIIRVAEEAAPRLTKLIAHVIAEL